MFHSALPRHLRCFALKIMPIDPKPYLAYRRIAAGKAERSEQAVFQRRRIHGHSAS